MQRLTTFPFADLKTYDNLDCFKSFKLILHGGKKLWDTCMQSKILDSRSAL